MARATGKKNGGGAGRTGRDNGLTVRGKPKSKPAGKSGSAKGTGKGRSEKRRNTGKK